MKHEITLKSVVMVERGVTAASIVKDSKGASGGFPLLAQHETGRVHPPQLISDQ